MSNEYERTPRMVVACAAALLLIVLGVVALVASVGAMLMWLWNTGFIPFAVFVALILVSVLAYVMRGGR